MHVSAVEQHVGHLFGRTSASGPVHPGQMSSLDQHPSRTEVVDPTGQLDHRCDVGSIRGVDAGQDRCLEEVRGDQQCLGDQTEAIGLHGLVVEQPPAGGGNHDWIDHERRKVPGCCPLRHQPDSRCGGEHPGLDCGHSEVVQDRADLGIYDVGGHGMDGGDRDGVLCGHRRDHRCGEHSQRAHRLEVGLQARSGT